MPFQYILVPSPLDYTQTHLSSFIATKIEKRFTHIDLCVQISLLSAKMFMFTIHDKFTPSSNRQKNEEKKM